MSDAEAAAEYAENHASDVFRAYLAGIAHGREQERERLAAALERYADQCRRSCRSDEYHAAEKFAVMIRTPPT